MHTEESLSTQKSEVVADIKKEKPLIRRPQLSEALIGFKEEFEKQENIEEKLKMVISFMKGTLSQVGTPSFKDFWEAKNMSFPLFKDKINPFVKSELWVEYMNLSTEAKRLKAILEEQSDFIVQQIDLAIQALEADLSYHEKSMVELKLPAESSDKEAFYEQKQHEIQFYATLTSRMKELRKEIIATDMRIRHKNKLLERLSVIGDRFIPKHKELIKIVNQSFISDVTSFMESSFVLEEGRVKTGVSNFYKLKEEIKYFQHLAKKTSLNSQAFATTRVILSQCWEILQTCEKEKKEASKAYLEEASSLIRSFSSSFETSPAASQEQVYQKSREVILAIEKYNLAYADLKYLKNELKQAQEEALKPILLQEKEAFNRLHAKEISKKAELELFKQEIHQITSNSHEQSLKDLEMLFEVFDDKVASFKLDLKDEFQMCEMKWTLYENLLLKKEKETHLDDIDNLQNLGYAWELFREDTRSRLEKYRKSMGSSGFDFEKAMLY
ncbi:MAG: hypothetical protein WCG10_00005, partial [Chlamydiota bacterium]